MLLIQALHPRRFPTARNRFQIGKGNERVSSAKPAPSAPRNTPLHQTGRFHYETVRDHDNFDTYWQMTVPSTNVSMSAIQSVLGGTRPLKLSAYYKDIVGGPGYNVTGLPNQGSSISIGQFRGAQKPVSALQYPPPNAMTNSDSFYHPGGNGYTAGTYTFGHGYCGGQTFRQFVGNDDMSSDIPFYASDAYTSNGLPNGMTGTSTSGGMLLGEYIEVTLPREIKPTRWTIWSQSNQGIYLCSRYLIGYYTEYDNVGIQLGSVSKSHSVDSTISSASTYIKYRIVMTEIPPYTSDTIPLINVGNGASIYGTTS